jgi:hypothetical protein
MGAILAQVRGARRPFALAQGKPASGEDGVHALQCTTNGEEETRFEL